VEKRYIVQTLLFCYSTPADTFNSTRDLLSHQIIHVIFTNININGSYVYKLMRAHIEFKIFFSLLTSVMQVLS